MSKLIARFIQLLLALAGVALYQGCNSSVEKEVALAQLAESCLINTDCAAPLVCAFQLCHAECETSRDCDPGARCVGAARPYKVCQLEDERTCKRTVDCPEGLVCGVDGQCRDSCQADSDCVEGQVCVSGTCADKDELDDAGQLTPAPGTSSGSEGAPCVYVSDCNGALLCRSQACLPECRSDRDCGAHRVCQDTRCVDDGSQPPACAYNSDCKTSRGERCLSGTCRCSCIEDRDCPADQICDGCGCVIDPSKKAECAYNSDCTKAGEVCKSGACTCQCKQDQDCGEGQRCDGCGCVVKPLPTPDGVVLGDVTITSSLQLAQYRGVKSFAGDLTIAAPGLLDLGDTFDELEGIAGVFQLQGSNAVTRLSFPKLKSVGHAFIVQSAPALLELSLPVLETALVVNVVASPHLTSLVLTNYQNGSIDVAGGISELSVPALQHAGTLSVHDGPNLKTLSAPALLDVQGNIYLANLPQLTSVATPLLASIGTGDGTGSLTLQSTGILSLSSLLDQVVATLDMPTPHKLQALMLANNCALTDGGAYAQYFVNVQVTSGACK